MFKGNYYYALLTIRRFCKSNTLQYTETEAYFSLLNILIIFRQISRITKRDKTDFGAIKRQDTRISIRGPTYHNHEVNTLLMRQYIIRGSIEGAHQKILIKG